MSVRSALIATAAAAALQLLPLTQARLLLNRDSKESLEREVQRKLGYTRDSFCSDPTPKAPVEFPESLIGRVKVNFEMYSGYIPISDAPDYLFYWFFSSQDGNKDAPLVIWTNGGPGCSSMEAATTEHSPLNLVMIKEACSNKEGQCDYTGQLSQNPYAWNKHANVLYLDQPKNVGYSYGYSKEETGSSTEAAADFVTFVNAWMEYFPEFVGRPLVISGESYAGHYLPAFASAILDYNAQLTGSSSKSRQLSTEEESESESESGEGEVARGVHVMKASGSSSSSAPLNFRGVLLGNGCVNDTVQNSETFVQFQHEENLIPADASPRSAGAARLMMENYLGYEANYYDYRVESVSCSACYSYNYTAWSYWHLQSEVLDALNVCGDAGQDAFAGSAGGCINMGAFDAHDSFDYSGALARTLEAGIPVTLYYGKTDTACDYVSGMAMASSVSWTGAEGFNAQEMSSLTVAGLEVGQVKAYDGFTFMQVDGAGHMTPLNRPESAYLALDSILKAIPQAAAAAEK